MSAPDAQPQPPPSAPAPAIREIPTWLALGLLAALTLGMFFHVLFVHPKQVLSSGDMDLNYFFIHWLHFGFGELTAGRLALWNPHYFSGAPFFGGFQPALLYPLNFLYLSLPLEAAVNWTIALHVFLAGAFTFFWTRYRGLHSWACLLAAVMFMFCGPHFLHIYAGHLPNLCTMIWVPLLFLAIDQLLDRPSLGPCLLGGFVVAMAVFAGHPQYVFFMAVAAAVYCLLNLIGARERGKVIAGLALTCLFGIGLSAVQMFTGLQEARETLRSTGVSYAFASTYSFPPENLLTLLTPWFFGDIQNSPYWGRWHLTEMSLFVSVSGLILALYGAIRGQPAARRFSLCMVIVALVLASGAYTPIFPFLYHHVPGFNKFRGFAKFIWLAALFLSMLAATGWDAMLKQSRTPRWLIGVSIGFALGLAVLAFLLPRSALWPSLLKSLESTAQTELPFKFVQDTAVVAKTSAQAVSALGMGAASFAVLALVLILSNRSRAAACKGIVALAFIELCAFAGHSLTTFQIAPPYPDSVANFLKQHPGDYRILADNPNSAMTAGTQDIWGNDSEGLLRYVRFLAFTKGYDFDTITAGTRSSTTNSAAWGLVRCRFVFSTGAQPVLEIPDALPHLLLVNRCRIMTNRYEILSTITNSDFPRRQEVILETPPDPAPQPASDPGTVRLLDSSTDSLTIEAAVGAPTLLLITDTYSSGWRALALPGSSQNQYQILPADYCLRAIPLAAGHHRIEVEYSPLGFRIGKWVSVVSLVTFMICLVWVWKRTGNSQLQRPNSR